MTLGAGNGRQAKRASADTVSRSRVSDEDRALYLSLRDQGISQSQATLRIGRTGAWGSNFDKKLLQDPNEAIRLRALIGSQVEVTGPKTPDQLTELARRCLEDFELFRVTCFGRRSRPWSIDAAHRMAELWETEHREMVVMNVAPGAGKTTMVTDTSAWLTCRSRSIRGAMGAVNGRLATSYTARLRTELERHKPLRATSEAADKRGQSDATHTMSMLFGRFKAPNPDLWRREAFTVEQIDSRESGEKEATWTMASMEGEFIGDRLDFMAWDDAVTVKRVRSEDQRNSDQETWDRIIEARLEPGGLLWLVGQRLHQLDLYRYCLDKATEIDVGGDEPELQRTYHHIVYPAHDPDRCRGNHAKDAPAWSPADPKAGCLLDPSGLPWRDIEKQQKRDSHTFQLVYQQDDTTHSQSLVQRLWIDGGRDPDSGLIYPGCFDDERRPEEIPILEGRVLSYVTVDPSSKNWWSIIWTLYEVETQRRYLIDMRRARMAAPDLLDRSSVGTFTGLMEQWQKRSVSVGRKITDWIIEANSQQKWLMQYGFIRDWRDRNGVRLTAHHTNNKTKPDGQRGIEATLRAVYQQGLVRIPGTIEGRHLFKPLLTEVTSWPYHTTDDCAMSQWFGEYNLPHLMGRTAEAPEIVAWRPTWMGGQYQEEGNAERALARFAGAR